MERVRHFVRKNRGLLVFGALIVSLLVGCGGKEVGWPSHGGDDGCRQLWAETEAAIWQGKVADPTTVRVRNSPYLRADRYLQALAAKAVGQEQQHYVLEQMRLLDLDKRLVELSRLSEQRRAELARGLPLALHPRLASCSKQFLEADRQGQGFFAEVSQGLDLDRDYSLWLRSVGLYPLTSLVVDYVAEKAQEEMVARLQGPAPESVQGQRLIFRPQLLGHLSPVQRRQLLAGARNNPMMSLELSPADLLGLVQDFAPLLTIAAGDDGERFGRVVIGESGFEVDGRQPVVYYYFSQTFVQGIPALQINYAIWFAERGAPAPWFEQGLFDGLNFRVTLDWQGQPVFVDVSFQCGCYHFVLYDDNLVSGKVAEAKGFQPFVGGKIPRLDQGERLQFSVNRGWHQIGHIGAARPANDQLTYQLRPYQELEYFKDGSQVLSLFDQQGRVPGTNRLERFFLFPMGIVKVGAMRQRGRQPITLIGRAYLDDPYLFDNAFAYRTTLPAVADLTTVKKGAPEGSARPLTGPEQTGEAQ